MSYRDDHDAALARIDALEAELARSHGEQGEAEAREELFRLEGEIKKLRRERERLRRGEREVRRGWIAALLGVVGVLGAVAFVAFIVVRPHARGPAAADAVPPVAAAPAPKPAPPSSSLMSCVAQLDRSIDAGSSVGSECIREIERQADDLSLGRDVHRVLRDWLAAEQAIVDGADHGARDKLAVTIHRVVRPEFIR